MNSNKKIFYLVGTVLLVVFAGFSYSEFKGALTPYVPYETAREAPRTVQVAGGLQQGSTSYDEEAGALLFTLVEPETNETLAIRYEGIKPANFEEAISIVAIGQFDPQANEFAAKQLLVKCPSKYQGLEEVETKTYS
ncbi:MAG: cytochrome c maturation protein CcmE [Acidobacteriota bacterium]